MAQTDCQISGIWLRREEVDDDYSDAVVLVEIDGRWYEVLRERLNGIFSSSVSASGIESACRGVKDAEFIEVAGEANSVKRRQAVEYISGARASMP